MSLLLTLILWMSPYTGRSQSRKFCKAHVKAELNPTQNVYLQLTSLARYNKTINKLVLVLCKNTYEILKKNIVRAFRNVLS